MAHDTLTFNSATQRDLLVLVIAGRSRERTKPLLDQLSALQLPYQIIPAVYLDSESCQRIPPTRVSPLAIKTMALSEIGCALAHQDAYAAALSSGVAHALILEDDAEQSPSLAELLGELASLPAYDVILLSRAKISRHEYRMSRWYYPVRAIFQTAGLRVGLTRRIRRSGTSAYLASADGLRKLQAANLPVCTLADDWPQFISRLEVLQTSPLAVYEDYLGKGSEVEPERTGMTLAARQIPLRKKASLLLRALLEKLAFALLALRYPPRDLRQIRRKA